MMPVIRQIGIPKYEQVVKYQPKAPVVIPKMKGDVVAPINQAGKTVNYADLFKNEPAPVKVLTEAQKKKQLADQAAALKAMQLQQLKTNSFGFRLL